MKRLILFALLALVCVRGAFAQTPPGAYSSPATGAIVNGAGSNPLGASLNVRAFPYSAVGDGKIFWDGVSNAGNNQLTSATATFAASDVGHKISCVGNPASVSAALWPPGQTTVATFVNSSTITYTGTNAGVLSGMACKITNPADATAIASAFAACKSTFNAPSSQLPYQALGCNMYVPVGIYGVSATLDNLISSGNEGCVGIIGDGIAKSGLVPEATFTYSGHQGWLIHDRCNGGNLQNFFIEDASTPRNLSGTPDSIIEFFSGNSNLQNVAIYDQCNTNGAFVYGVASDGGTSIQMSHLTVINNGSCTGSSGGLLLNGIEGDVYTPFLSNTQQNLKVQNQATGANGAGVRVWGGVIDEGSVTSVTASIDTWFIGTTLTGGANCLSVDGTSFVWVYGGYCGTFGGNTGSGPTVLSGGKLLLSDVHVNGVNAGSYCYNIAAAGGIQDIGGNRCTLSGGATAYNAGSFVVSSSLTHTYPQPFLAALPTSGTAQTIVAFTPSQAVSVANFSITSSNSATCATPPTFQISNGAQAFTQTFASSGNISGPFTPTQTVTNDVFPAGTQITLSITTAAYTCATAPVNMNWSIEWQSSAPSL